MVLNRDSVCACAQVVSSRIDLTLLDDEDDDENQLLLPLLPLLLLLPALLLPLSVNLYTIESNSFGSLTPINHIIIILIDKSESKYQWYYIY